jgi:nucleotide-binding universal stress UspA family protein
MLRLNRILLASDFSASAEAALLYATTLARQTHASLLVLHVLDTRVAALPRWSDIFRATDLFADQASTAAAAMQQLLAHPALEGLAVDTLTRSGNPQEKIIDTASEVDMVVLGTQGHGMGIGKTPGRTACSVAHGSPVPVLLIPPGGGAAGVPVAGAARLPLRQILLALHFAQYAPQAITLSRALAMAYQASWHILQVVEPDKVASYPLAAGEGLYHNLDAMKVLLRKHFATLVPDDPTGPPLERSIVEGQAAEMILRHRSEQAADLLVMSAHAYGPLHKFFRVSTIDLVLEQAPCPLLAVPFPLPTAAVTIPGTGAVSAG